MAPTFQMKQYTRAKVDAASPEDTLLLLVAEATRAAERARLTQDAAERRNLLDKSRRIVAELASSLNTDVAPEIAFNLLRLYTFINRRLTDAVSGEDAGLPDALRILRHVRETWEQAVALARRERARGA
jgi:flagellar protein FliS